MFILNLTYLIIVCSNGFLFSYLFIHSLYNWIYYHIFVMVGGGHSLFLWAKWYMQNGGGSLRSSAAKNRRKGSKFPPNKPRMQVVNQECEDCFEGNLKCQDKRQPWMTHAHIFVIRKPRGYIYITRINFKIKQVNLNEWSLHHSGRRAVKTDNNFEFRRQSVCHLIIWLFLNKFLLFLNLIMMHHFFSDLWDGFYVLKG